MEHRIVVSGLMQRTTSGSSKQGEFHPELLTEPYLIVSHHTALVIPSFYKSKNCQCRNILGQQSSAVQIPASYSADGRRQAPHSSLPFQERVCRTHPVKNKADRVRPATTTNVTLEAVSKVKKQGAQSSQSFSRRAQHIRSYLKSPFCRVVILNLIQNLLITIDQKRYRVKPGMTKPTFDNLQKIMEILVVNFVFLSVRCAPLTFDTASMQNPSGKR